MSASQDQQILRELMHASRRDPSLLQFRSVVSAHQYLPAYRLARKYLAPGSLVLDWGTGNGHFAYFLVRAGYHARSFSFDKRPLACAALSPERYGHVEGAADDPVRLPFPEAAFDGVVSIGVLEHVRETGGDEQKSLAEIRRVLRPGGVFICYHLPNYYSIIEQGVRLVGRYAHSYRYTRGDIVALTDQTGLELQELRRYASLPRNLWRDIPWAGGDSGSLARAYDLLDLALSIPLNPVCQCYQFVARRPRESPACSSSHSGP